MTVLDDILAGVAEDLAGRMAATSMDELKRQAERQSQAIDPMPVFRADGVAANTLWPRTTIATAAVQNLLGGDRLMAASRTPEIYADAAHLVLTTPSRERTGQSLLVEDVLAEVGITDLSRYAAVPGTPDEALFPDVFL